jgi:hypothetical protein
MFRVANLISALVLGAVTAQATPWWASWSGDDGYPETVGWNRFHSDPPPQRWLEDGNLFIDSRGGDMWEVYSQLRPGEMTLAPGETLRVHWRVLVADCPVSEDPGVGAKFDDRWTVSFSLGVGMIVSDYEPSKGTTFEPGVFHDFSFESSDARTYVLSIDGVPSLWGNFSESLFDGPGIGWGDHTSVQSLSEWTFFEGGIVPEPNGFLCMVACLGLCRWPRRSY